VNLALVETAPAGLRATALVVLVAGLGVATVGYLGWQARLPRNRFAGVRTPTAMRSEDAFRVANQVAGVPVMVAGLVGVFGGVAAFFLPSTAAAVTALVVVLIGMAALAVAGGVLGSRAAAALPAEPTGGCGGCCCGGCG
jgi:uncharacterized membrane protein